MIIKQGLPIFIYKNYISNFVDMCNMILRNHSRSIESKVNIFIDSIETLKHLMIFVVSVFITRLNDQKRKWKTDQLIR